MTSEYYTLYSSEVNTMAGLLDDEWIEYFGNGWNIFDLTIVVASIVDLGLESVDGISVLRGMRLVSIQHTFIHSLTDEYITTNLRENI